MIYLTKRYNKIGQIQEVRGLIGENKYSFGHSIWVDIEPKCSIDLIKQIFEKYSILIGYPLPTMVMQQTIINIYKNSNKL